MNLTYKRATLEDIDILVKTRIEVLKAANKLCVDTDIKKLFAMALILRIWSLMEVVVLELVVLVFFK